MDDSHWREALHAMLAAGMAKATIADAMGTAWITIHRLSRDEVARPHPRTRRDLVRLAVERGALAA